VLTEQFCLALGFVIAQQSFAIEAHVMVAVWALMFMVETKDMTYAMSVIIAHRCVVCQ